MERQKGKVFALVLSRCDKAMTNRLESYGSEYEELVESSDVKGLMEQIKALSIDANGLQYMPMQAADAWKALSSVCQRDDEHVVDYYHRFDGLVEVVERSFGLIGAGKDVNDEVDRDNFLAAVFLNGASRKRFGALLNNLRMDHSLGTAKYPKNAEKAMQVLLAHEENRPRKKNGSGEDGLTLSFAQGERLCWRCNKPGHRKVDCKEVLTEVSKGASNVQAEAPKTAWYN